VAVGETVGDGDATAVGTAERDCDGVARAVGSGDALTVLLAVCDAVGEGMLGKAVAVGELDCDRVRVRCAEGDAALDADCSGVEDTVDGTERVGIVDGVALGLHAGLTDGCAVGLGGRVGAADGLALLALADGERSGEAEIRAVTESGAVGDGKLGSALAEADEVSDSVAVWGADGLCALVGDVEGEGLTLCRAFAVSTAGSVTCGENVAAEVPIVLADAHGDADEELDGMREPGPDMVAHAVADAEGVGAIEGDDSDALGAAATVSSADGDAVRDGDAVAEVGPEGVLASVGSLDADALCRAAAVSAADSDADGLPVGGAVCVARSEGTGLCVGVAVPVGAGVRVGAALVAAETVALADADADLVEETDGRADSVGVSERGVSEDAGEGDGSALAIAVAVDRADCDGEGDAEPVSDGCALTVGCGLGDADGDDDNDAGAERVALDDAVANALAVPDALIRADGDGSADAVGSSVSCPDAAACALAI
jgi:hypothetical protein